MTMEAIKMPSTLLDLLVATEAEHGPRGLRDTFGCFPSGVTAVSARVDGELVGLAASSFTSVSLSPALVSVCIDNGSTTWPRLSGVPRLGVSVLSESHEVAARQLASRVGDRFADLPVEISEDDAVLVHGATAWFDCSLEAELPAGDHIIALLRVHRHLAQVDTSPLVFHGSRFRRLDAIVG